MNDYEYGDLRVIVELDALEMSELLNSLTVDEVLELGNDPETRLGFIAEE